MSNQMIELPEQKSMPITRTYPNRVREIRLKKGYTLRKCADDVGVTPQAISKVERMNEGLTVHNLLRLASCLETSLDDLIPMQAKKNL